MDSTVGRQLIGIFLALTAVATVVGCGSTASPSKQAADKAEVVAAAEIATPVNVHAELQGKFVVMQWSPPAGVSPSGYRVYVDQHAPVELAADKLSYKFKAGKGGSQYFLQVQTLQGPHASKAVATEFEVPFPKETAPPENMTETGSTSNTRTSATAPGRGIAPNGPASAEAAACGEANQQVLIVLAALRDWEGNLAVQGDMTEKLGPPGDAVASLASRLSPQTAAQAIALADAIKSMRQAFFGHGDVLPDGKQTAPRDYDTLKAKIAAGIPGC